MNKFLSIFIFLVALTFSLMSAPFAKGADSFKVNPVRVYVFHSETCPHCKDELEFLEKVKKDFVHVEVLDFELSGFKNQSLYAKVIEQYGLNERGFVPATVIGDYAVTGFDDEDGLGKQLLSKIADCSVNEPCDSWLDETLGKEKPSEAAKVELKEKALKNLGVEIRNDNREGTIKVFGKEFDLKSQSSTYVLGVILGLADGINPCMFSVLLFLLTYLLAVGSRKRAIKAGVAFALTTFVVYFLFMLGLINVVEILGIAHWFRIIIILFALVLGVIMIKDFFFYGKWVSLEIPERFKPTIKGLIKKGTLPSAIILALLSSIVELPCTSGIPLAYISVLAERNLNPLPYLAVYNAFFVIPLLIIILFVAFAWAKTEQFEQTRNKMRKYMRLVGGILLILLALALWQNWI